MKFRRLMQIVRRGQSIPKGSVENRRADVAVGSFASDMIVRYSGVCPLRPRKRTISKPSW